MMIVGLAGGFDAACRLDYDLSYDFMHDAAAVLLDNGTVAAAIEQERLNRIKHTNRSGAPAVRACLATHGVHARDVDCFAFYATEDACNQVLYAYHTRKNVGRTRVDVRSRLTELLSEELDYPVDPARLHFADHHMCHALGTYVDSGFDRALVATIDGAGEGNAGLVLRAVNGEFETLHSFPDAHSLGYFYRETIRFLGYDMFEEYKVMGLAPYGDPARFRDFFRGLYELNADGSFQVSLHRIPQLHTILAPRQKDQPFVQIHKDLAASLQEALETIVMHMLRHYRQATGETRLCLSGGVAHNSSLNGKILCSGLFEEVFVHPAAHDAGGALGAALHAHRSRGPLKTPSLTHAFLGRDLGRDAEIARTLDAWTPLVSVERLADPCRRAAEVIAGGAVIGWVQGRSEFGPRALGNRSILADPRPADNTARINKMIKKREAYRPFAPSVQEEHAREYFELPPGRVRLPFMSCVVPVRPDKRSLLGAITHVDGSARLQTVSREDNPRYWDLIGAFGDITGVPVLLNTSFNNNVEPIVDTLDEAVVCYLTTGLDYLVAGDYLVTRKPIDRDVYRELIVSVPAMVALAQIDAGVTYDRREQVNELYVRTDKGRRHRVSDAAYRLLLESDGKTTIGALLDRNGRSGEQATALLDELLELWALRLVTIGPLHSHRSA